MASYLTFPTEIGRCAIAWSADVVVGTALPGSDEASTVRSARRTCRDASEGAAPPWLIPVIERIQNLLAGHPTQFEDVPLAFDQTNAFERDVYRAALAIPHGETRTYGEIATAIGKPGAARAVGGALGRNPIPIIVPCHRVLSADGRSGGFSAPGGAATKMKLLDIERAERSGQGGLFDDLSWAVRRSPA